MILVDALVFKDPDPEKKHFNISVSPTQLMFFFKAPRQTTEYYFFKLIN